MKRFYEYFNDLEIRPPAWGLGAYKVFIIVVPDCKFNKNMLSDKEIEVLKKFYNKFKDFTSSEISCLLFS